MATHAITRFNLVPFWDDEYKSLSYMNEMFNDPLSQQQWIMAGYADRFTGDMCDMRNQQPSWNHRFIELFSNMGWKNIGTSYYRMQTGTVLPVHGDLYSKYVDIFDLHDKTDSIVRAIVFLEDWKSGHYFEAMNQAITGWTAGTTVVWTYDTPHMAANIGLEPRYTLQITGHL